MHMREVRTLVVLVVCVLAAAGAACRSGPEDATITTSVKSKMAADAAVSASTVNVDTKDGVVTLTGTVDNEAAKARAETIAKGTEGVKSVTNNLTVRPPVATAPPAGSANDTAIENAISANLTKAGITGVTVEVEDGVATLSGSVPKAQMIKAVQAANEANPKPTKVNNQLTGT